VAEVCYVNLYHLTN